MAKIVSRRNTEVAESPIAKFIFGDTRFAAVWVVLRVYLGYQWISAAQHKLTDPAWYQTGAALKGFWLNAVATTPKPVIAFDWYRGFLQFMIDSQAYTWFAKLVIAGEVMVGAALILGAFTGIAAFIGGFMNWNFMMAGSASTNPLLFALAVFLILAWKTAGYYGLDRYLLPLLGTPWKPGITIQVREPAPEPAPIR
jgi:thiosulfate dehydrogenase (quinone) large subunit